MSRRFIGFRWQIPEPGFRWIVAKPTGLRHSRGGFVFHHGYQEDEIPYGDWAAPFLVPAHSVKPSIYVRRDRDPSLLQNAPTRALDIPSGQDYEPLVERPALFREFADLEIKLGSICTFANKRGSLGGDRAVEVAPIDSDGQFAESSYPVWGEILGAWADDIRDMRIAVGIWDLIQGGGADEIDRHIDWRDPENIYWEISLDVESASDDELDESLESDERLLAYWRDVVEGRAPWDKLEFELPRDVIGNYCVAGSNHFPERLNSLKDRNPRLAARYVLHDLIDRGLKSRVSPTMHVPEQQIASEISFKPNGLIGALWLQFALAVDGNTEFDRCTQCSEWFELGPGSGRPDKRYCSDACRMRAYRKRKAAATKRDP